MSSKPMAPIAMFAFNRVEHLRRAVESLAACPEAPHSALTLYCDGARRPDEQAAVEAVRRYAAGITGFASVTVDAAPANRGLAASVMRGVADQLNRFDAVIVLEDDLVVSPHFLRYMNDALAHYADDPRVASVHGYSYPTPEPLPDTFFLQGADCWGWATWARAWKHFEPDGAKLLAELRRRRLTRAFDLDGSYPYAAMLADQIAGRNSSWAIRWHAACYLRGLLTLYPGRSLVENIGNDSSGTHCETSDAMSRAPTTRPVAVGGIPVEPCEPARAAFARFLAGQRSWRARVRGSVRRLLRVEA
ncbi:glycosyltransferase [Piscinibacter sp. XHJ-5]|uniref:glycosyltransferase n=1 Tax=Piscinibacter sp. XHJ-5 TaxID=3037797 RepID=UPI002452DCFD|nr:glycosyltransferase [Piscinibacter sp. XHJ-5]